MFQHILIHPFHRDRGLLHFDSKIRSVRLCPQLHRCCKFAENPRSCYHYFINDRDIRTDGRTDEQTNRQKHTNKKNELRQETMLVCALLLFLGPGTGPHKWPPTFLFLLLLLLSDLRSAKAFSFHNRSWPNFPCTWVTTLSTIAPWRIFKISPN